ncbi:hypothetical protein pb186bvf_016244 [Paramecium bursaria]
MQKGQFLNITIYSNKQMRQIAIHIAIPISIFSFSINLLAKIRTKNDSYV